MLSFLISGGAAGISMSEARKIAGKLPAPPHCACAVSCALTLAPVILATGLGSSAGSDGFYKLSADHSECKQASHIGNNVKSWHVGTCSDAGSPPNPPCLYLLCLSPRFMCVLVQHIWTGVLT
jgi:hypothetical protein